jgi:hypothetical protein
MRPDLKYPCPSHPPYMQPATSPHGRTVCLLEASGNNLEAEFDASGIQYQFTTLAGAPRSSQEPFLLTLIDNLS